MHWNWFLVLLLFFLFMARLLLFRTHLAGFPNLGLFDLTDAVKFVVIEEIFAFFLKFSLQISDLNLFFSFCIYIYIYIYQINHDVVARFFVSRLGAIVFFTILEK